jgi:hypothetical protein
MAERWLISTREKRILLSNTMGQEIASALHRVRFHQMAPAHIRIIHIRRTGNGATTAISHPNATALIALHYREIMITAGRPVENGVTDVEVI